MFEPAMTILEAYSLVKDAYLKLSAPTLRVPRLEPYERETAIIGEVGPELVLMQDGTRIITYSRLVEIPRGTKVIPAPSGCP